MKIVLVRHGQTYANEAHALDTSRPGLPLTAGGLTQAADLASRWESEVGQAPTVVAVSPLFRTRQTCAPLCAKYALTPLVRPGIRELRSGDVEMNADPFSDSVYVEGTGNWSHGATHIRMSGGETGEDALARALPVIAEVAGLVLEEDPDGVGVIVAHGALLRLLASTLAHNISGTLVMTHFMSNTGTVILQWPTERFGTSVPHNPDDLRGAFTGLTWNNRPVDQWDLED